MKKLYSTPKWKTRQRLVKAKALRRSTRLATGSHALSLKRRSAQFEIRAPHCFSLLENTEAAARFLRQVEEKCSSGRARVSIDFSEMTSVTPEALMALIALMKKKSATVGGNMPRDPVVKEALI